MERGYISPQGNLMGTQIRRETLPHATYEGRIQQIVSYKSAKSLLANHNPNFFHSLVARARDKHDLFVYIQQLIPWVPHGDRVPDKNRDKE